MGTEVFILRSIVMKQENLEAEGSEYESNITLSSDVK